MEEDKKIKEILEELDLLIVRSKEGQAYHIALEVLERALIANALRITFGNKLKAARLLGINRNTLHSKIKKLQIDTKSFK